MEGVDHVDVLQIGSRRFIRDVDRMLQRQIPDRERLELRVPRLHAALVVVVQLRQAGGQFAAAAAGAVDDDQRFGDFDVRIGAVALFTDDGIDVGRIALREGMLVDADAAALQAPDEHVDDRVVLVAGDDHAVDRKVPLAEHVDDAQHFEIIGDAEVLARLAGGDIAGVDADDDLRLVLHLLQELDLGVLIKSRQHAHRMLVLDQLAAELQIEAAFLFVNPFQDVAGLLLDILVRIKSDLLHLFPFLF